MSVWTWDPDFEDFAVRRSRALLRTAVFLTGDHHAAEDLVQTALVRTARRWKHAQDNPEAYVRQVLVNLNRDGWRARLRRVEEVPLEFGPADDAGSRRSLLDRVADPRWAAGPGTSAGAAGFGAGVGVGVGVGAATAAEHTVDTRDELLRALRQLPARQRTAVVLRFWEELSVAETAAAMGCSEGTVKSATSRGLDRLREVLGLPGTAATGPGRSAGGDATEVTGRRGR